MAKKSNPCARMEKCRILALGIFRLQLYPSTTGIISMEAAKFVGYEKTKINSSIAILAEIFLSLNHCENIGKGFMRCWVSLLFIWMVSHIEAETPIFTNFWWFNQKPLKLFVSKEWENFSEVTLHGMNIHPSHIMLLGRPWLHVAQVIASSLHQQVMFIINGNLMIRRLCL